MAEEERPSFGELFDPEQPITSTKLLLLSGLSKEQADEVRGHWQRALLSRRDALLDQMLIVSEDNPEADFIAVFRFALDEQNPNLLVKAIDGLWECNERWLLDRLIGMAQDKGIEEVRAAATLALGKFVLLGALEELRPGLVERVEKALRSLINDRQEPVIVRRRAVEALSQSTDPSVHDIIRAAYYSSEFELKLASLYAMGQSCDEGWLPVLLSEMHNEDPAMRFEAARASGEMEDPRAIPSLLDLTKDEDAEVQEAAIEALGRIGGEEAKEALREIIASTDPHVREAAEAALEELSSGENPLSFTG